MGPETASRRRRAVDVLNLEPLHVTLEFVHRRLATVAPALRLHLPGSLALQAAGVLGGALMSLTIQVTNRLYRAVALVLTDWENHRTETQYEDALILKTFTFQVRDRVLMACV